MAFSSTGTNYEPRNKIDTTVPHSARVWNYWLGGKDNYTVDREAGDMVREICPGIVDIARGTRAFLIRAVRYLAGEVGIRQFLDIGTGLPTSNNTHEVAQRIAPESRVVYVDNDPLVLVHARALLVGTPQGATDYIEADVREPDKIMECAARTLDFTKPIALTMLGVLGLISDDDQARSIVKRLVDSLPSGSYLVHEDEGPSTEEIVEANRRYNSETGAVPYTLRTPETMARFFDGLELIEPGIVDVTQWRPEPGRFGVCAPVHATCGVGRKP